MFARRYRKLHIALALLLLGLTTFASAPGWAEEQPPAFQPPQGTVQSEETSADGNTTRTTFYSDVWYDESGNPVNLGVGYETEVTVEYHPSGEPPPDNDGSKGPEPPPPLPVTRIDPPSSSLASFGPSRKLLQAGGRIYDQESVDCHPGSSGIMTGVLYPNSSVKMWWTFLEYTNRYPYYRTYSSASASSKCPIRAAGYCSFGSVTLNHSYDAEPWIAHISGVGTGGYINWAGCY
jgi:hypothetical protein